jgi:hypothetical protein
MKLAKSLLLGSAAALATVAGAQAADLPVRKAAPVAVEYVRICSTYGAGFFVVPGTDSCLKIGGRVRADALIQERFHRGQDTFGFRVRGRMSFDVRTPTPYGLLRTFVRLAADSNSGSPFGATGGNANVAYLDQGFIQFGGLTAGRTASFFSNPDLPTRHMGTLRFDDAPDVTTFAYTYSFGNGLSVSVAAEDPFVRRNGGQGAFGGIAIPAGYRFAGVAYGGAEYPDVVGNIKWAGTWGTAQISGAVHQVVDIGPALFGVPGARRAAQDDEVGFAVAGYLGVNLPMIAAGDAAWLAVTYTDGATAYLSGGNAGSRMGSGGNAAFGRGFGFGNAGNTLFTDAVVNVGGGRSRIETTEGLAVAGGFTHMWAPTFETNVFGSWMSIDFPGGADVRGLGGVGRVGFVDFEEWRIGGNAIWRPVSGLQLGVEVLYTEQEFQNGRITITRAGAGRFPARARLDDSDDFIEGRIRVQRDF